MRRTLTFIVVVALSAAVARSATPSVNPSRTLTLITGDRVTISAGKPAAVSVHPRKGRERMQFLSHFVKLNESGIEHYYVIPADAVPLIASGLLDRQLFDVTEQLESKYDDASRDTVPLIVTYHVQPGLSASAATLAGTTLTRELFTINGLAANARKRDTGPLWDSLAPAESASTNLAAAGGTIKKIWLDRLIKPVLDQSVPLIGAPAAWARGYQGNGVRVAVADSGVDATHPDLAGKIVAQRNFTPESGDDLVGHGTHVASIIAGSGAASGGKYRGVAPGAELISAKVCQVFGCELSAVIDGIQWAVTEAGAKIVNLSLSGPDDPAIDPLEEAVNALTESHGALFVIAVGNSGNLAFTVESPGSTQAALTVGAVNRKDEVARFSGRGPAISDRGIKPDITAPGVAIVAARGADTALGKPVSDSYTAVSGTSMATPHVAGAAALLAQLHPDYGAAQLKSALIGSARPAPNVSIFDQGAGRVDIAAAFANPLTAEPASLSFGTARYPHDDDAVLKRVVTYRNAGTTTITLALKTEITVLGGGTPSAGVFSLDRKSLRLGPGASGSVTLTVDTHKETLNGVYGGRIVALGDGASMSTPLSIEREFESYDIQLTHIDRQGLLTSIYQTLLVPVDVPPLTLRTPFVAFGPPETTVRLRAGRYGIVSNQVLPDNVLLLKPLQVIDGPLSLTFDARQASPITLKPPTSSAEQFFTAYGVQVPTSYGLFGLDTTFSPPAPIYGVTLGPPVPGVISHITAQWTDEVQSSAAESAPFYGAVWARNGQFLQGPTLAVKPEQQALVRAQFGSAFSEIKSGFALIAPNIGDASYAFAGGLPTTLPSRRTEHYFSTGAEITWFNGLLLDAPQPFQLVTGRNTYRPQQVHAARWNEPPFGPGFPANAGYPVRVANLILLQPPLWSDRGGHAGFSGSGTNVTVALYREGEKIGEADNVAVVFEVPAERATYRAECSGTNYAFGLSSRVSGAWTFTSEHVNDETAQTLPLMSVSFEPRLNERGQAPRGVNFEVPVSVRQVGKHGPVVARSLIVDVSYDDGATWQRVNTRRDGEQWIAALKHPKQKDFVSLRASARDYSTNAVEQTIIRAYALAERSRNAP